MLRVIFLSLVLVAVIVFASVAEDGAPQAASNQAPAVDRFSPRRDKPKELIPPNAAGLPHDCAPQHALASVIDGKLHLVRFSFQSESREVVAEIEAEGEETAESILRFVSVGTPHSTSHDLTDVRAMADGAYLQSEELAKRLEEPTKVLISAKKVDPFYLDMYKPGTIQLIVPASVLKEPIKGNNPYGATYSRVIDYRVTPEEVEVPDGRGP